MHVTCTVLLVSYLSCGSTPLKNIGKKPNETCFDLLKVFKRGTFTNLIIFYTFPAIVSVCSSEMECNLSSLIFKQPNHSTCNIEKSASRF